MNVKKTADRKAPKKPYRKPVLTNLGDVSALTQTGTMGGAENPQPGIEGPSFMA